MTRPVEPRLEPRSEIVTPGHGLHREVREEFKRESERIREEDLRRQMEDAIAGRAPSSNALPTQVKLTDPSKPLNKFCVQCGASHAEPFGPHQIAAKLQAHGQAVEIYPCGGIVIHTNGPMVILSRFNRVILTPDK